MGALENIEVELKFPLFNKSDLIKKLNSIANLKTKGDYQKDTYFIPPHRNFLEKKPVSEWLRVRETQKGASVTYKNYHKENDAKSISCDEFETKIENDILLRKIFLALNFVEIEVVEKNRTSWMYRDVEISIDEVSNLGDYIELEAAGKFKDFEEAKKVLYEVLKEIGAKVGEQDFEGYPYLILKKKGLI
jgi:adenylate cyclase class 2